MRDYALRMPIQTQGVHRLWPAIKIKSTLAILHHREGGKSKISMVALYHKVCSLPLMHVVMLVFYLSRGDCATTRISRFCFQNQQTLARCAFRSTQQSMTIIRRKCLSTPLLHLSRYPSIWSTASWIASAEKIFSCPFVTSANDWILLLTRTILIR